MAQTEAPGGGYIDTGDRRVERKVFVNTGGGLISVPTDAGGGQLSAISATDEPGGVRRVVAEYTKGGAGDASYNSNGKRIELTGGSREVPIQTHPAFNNLTEQQLAEVMTRIENPENDLWFTTNTSGDSFTETQQLLYNFLRKKVEYVLAPSIVGRVSEIESALPGLDPIAKVANPPELSAPPKTFWVCTAITATPIGSEFEVTREFTLFFSEWDDVNTLYGWS